MMPQARRDAAYMVTPYLMTRSGELIEQGGTVCFDLALALEMAESDSAVMTRVCVFALDAAGMQVDPSPIAVFGMPSGDGWTGNWRDEDRPAGILLS